MAYTIHYSTTQSNKEGLLKLLQQDNKQHLLSEVLNTLIDYQPDEHGRVPLGVVSKNIHAIAKIVDDPCLGAKIIALIDIGHSELYKTLKHCARILETSGNKMSFNLVTTLIARYFSVLTQVARVDIQYYEHSVSIEFTPNQPKLVSYHQVEGAVVGLYRIIQSFSHAPLNSVSFTHSLPKNCGTTYEDIFSITPKHGNHKNQLIFSTPNSSTKLDQDSLHSLSAVQSLLDNAFPNLNDIQRCQHIILCILCFGEPTRDHVASIMNMSISTLQRKLRLENSSFKAILLATRKTLAHELIVNHKRSSSDLAFLLGYQSNSQFFKAFKTWFSMTPSEYKNYYLQKNTS